jgi:Phasin protein
MSGRNVSAAIVFLPVSPQQQKERKMSIATEAAIAGKNGLAHVREQTEAMTDLQKNLLATCEEIGEEWASRLQYEAGLWSELMGKLAAARSAPDFVGAYSDCLSRRLRMVGDDSQRVVEHYQRMTQHVADALSDGLQPWQAATAWMTKAYAPQRKRQDVSTTRGRKRKAS